MLTREDLPKDLWEHRYEIGVQLFDWRGKPVIWWRGVKRQKFLRALYAPGRIAQRSYPDDVLLMFHNGVTQHFGRHHFRALRA